LQTSSPKNQNQISHAPRVNAWEGEKMKKSIGIGILAAVLVVVLGTAAYNIVDVKAAGGLAAPVAGMGRGNGGNGQSGVGAGTSGTSTSTTSGYGNGNGIGTNVLDIPASELSDDEAAALLFMREEEKLARDVYNALNAKWNLPTFQNIASSEQMHMDQIGLLLSRYNLADPAKGAGVFTNADLQTLYTKLVAQGSLSVADAIKVGGAIEEIDIRDLESRLAKTDNADIQQVYNNLKNGSYNHLNAFARSLSNQTGETYAPQYLSADAYQSIISSGAGNGGGRPAWAGNGGGSGGKGGANH